MGHKIGVVFGWGIDEKELYKILKKMSLKDIYDFFDNFELTRNSYGDPSNYIIVLDTLHVEDYYSGNNYPGDSDDEELEYFRDAYYSDDPYIDQKLIDFFKQKIKNIDPETLIIELDRFNIFYKDDNNNHIYENTYSKNVEDIRKRDYWIDNIITEKEDKLL